MPITRVSLSGKKDLDTDPKDQGEEDVAEFFGEAFQEQFNEIIDELNAEDPQPPVPDFWLKWAGIFSAFLIPAFTDFQTTAVNSQVDDLGIGVDIDAVVDNASNFARTHVFALVQDLNESTRKHLQRSLQNFFGLPPEARSIEDLALQIAKKFGPSRAENIAITEVTRGFERGKDIYRDQLLKLGIRTEPRWHTMQDERVCIICEPNDGKLKSEGWTAHGIPAHPRDRCWTTIEVVEG